VPLRRTGVTKRAVDGQWIVRVRLLGSFEVEGVPERQLGSRKGRTVLKLLALARGAPVPVDRIADVLWGDDQPSRPADQVGVLVSRLRGVLGAERIARSDAGYALVADWIDVEEVVALGAASAEALAAGRLGAARAAADAALALVRGPLLPDEDGPWAETERRAVQAAVTRILRLAVDAAVAAGDHGAAAALAEQGLLGDPYDEAVLRALMEAHLAAGRPASALAAYARARNRLAEDLGVPPTADTEAVYLRALAAADGDQAPARRWASSGAGRRWHRSMRRSRRPGPGAWRSSWSRDTPGSARRPWWAPGSGRSRARRWCSGASATSWAATCPCSR
jgi:DNA-binding SARP family transcriptional activator